MADYTAFTSFYEIYVNGDLADERWNKYIDLVSVELNAYTVDVCKIELSIEHGVERDLTGIMLAKEGDFIQVLIGVSNVRRGTEHVFSGIVKTIKIEGEVTLSVTIEAFDELFLLDFDDTAMEVIVPDNAVTQEFNTLVERYQDGILNVLVSGNMVTDADTSRSRLLPYLRQIQAKFPRYIKEIFINEPDIPHDAKYLKSTNETPYQNLVRLARLYDRCLMLRNKKLYFVKRHQTVLMPFIYNPTVAEQVEENREFYIKRWGSQTTLKNQRANAELAYSRRIGSGTVVSRVAAQEARPQEPAPANTYLAGLEQTKRNMLDEIASEPNAGRKAQLQAYYDRWVRTTYMPTQEKANQTRARLTNAFTENRVYSYEVVLELGEGECVRVMSSAQFSSEEEALRYAKAVLNAKMNDFLTIEMELAVGNNIVRPWQTISVILQDESGECNGYYLRYSGEYKVSKVVIEAGKSGYKTEISAHRDFVIDDSNMPTTQQAQYVFNVTEVIPEGMESQYAISDIQRRINWLIKNRGWMNAELNRLIKYREAYRNKK